MRNYRQLLVIVLSGWLCVCAEAVTATIHVASHNPLTEGWSITAGDSGVTATPITGDPDFPDVFAWQINAQQPDGRLRYEIAGPTAAQSWSMSALMRVVAPADPVDAGILLEVANGSQRFLLTFGSNADGATLIDLSGGNFPEPVDITIPATQTGRTDYLHVEIAYLAASATADVFVNGELKASAYTGFASTLSRVNFGDGASSAAGVSRFANVTFTTSQPECSDGIDNDGDGFTDYSGADSGCQLASDTTEGRFCPIGADVDSDGICEQILVSHHGDINPAQEGWVVPAAAAGQEWLGGDNDLGAGGCESPCSYWRMTDTGTASGNLGAYTLPQFPNTAAGGWELRAKLRVAAYPGETTPPWSYSRMLLVRVPVSGGMRDYTLLFNWSGENALLRTTSAGDVNLGPLSSYSDIRLTYNPVAQNTDLRIDGELVVADYTGTFTAGDNQWVIGWGSGTSAGRGRTHWRSLAFEQNPDSDNDGLSNLTELTVSMTDPFAADSDGDGLADGPEVASGFDPLDADSDEDGLADGYEVANGLDPTRDDSAGDLDGDGLSNLEEQAAGTRSDLADSDADGLSDPDELNSYGTSPLSADSDDDGLTDTAELFQYATDPLLADTDADGVRDGAEVFDLHTDPRVADSDADGLSDGRELSLGSSPQNPDSDGDGLLDGFEAAHGFNPLTDSGEAAADGDFDQLTNLEEQQAGSNPSLFDSDHDGLPDYQEVVVLQTDPASADTDGDGLTDRYEADYGFDPLRATDARRDPDNDGLSLAHEQSLGTNPLLADTDADGIPDGDEVNIYQSDPLSAGAGLPATAYTSLRFVARNQPLFTDTPLPARYDISMPLAATQPNTQGRVETIKQQIPLLTAQQVWETAVSTCDAYSHTVPVSSYTSACRDLTVSPTRNQCIAGGNINLNNYSITCCETAGAIDVLDSISNGCGRIVSEDPGTFTLSDVNSLPGGPYAPTTWNIGPGIGPRPTQAPPPQDYTVGAEFSQSMALTAALEIATSTVDPGSLDVTYRTQSMARVDRSTAAVGSLVTLDLRHDPHGLQPGFTAETTMRSRWPDELLYARYEVGLDADISLEYWSIDPEDGSQLHGTKDILGGFHGETGNLARFEFIADEKLEVRFMEGVDFAPEAYQDVGFEITSDDIVGSFLNTGTKLSLGFSRPPVCPLELLAKKGKCFGLPATVPLSQEVARMQLQIAELDTPVSAGFNGGTADNFSLSLIQPKRNELDAAGRLINTVPNRFRPALNYTDNNSFTEEPLDAFVETFLKDNTDLSSDTSRWELDMDGLFTPVFPSLKGGISKFGVPVVTYSLEAADLDVVTFVGWDQTLTFDPNLTADIRFSKAVNYRLGDTGPLIPVNAGALVSIPVSLAARLQFEQPPGGVDIQVDYSFRNNRFSNNTRQTVSLVGQIELLKAALGGIVGSALSAGIGALAGTEFPLDFTGLRFSLGSQNLSSARRGGEHDVLSPQTTDFQGTVFTILDAAQDTDLDGLPNGLEDIGCTSSADMDSDDDGLMDGIEDTNHNGVVDAGETNPCLADTDGDGLTDGYERGLQTPTTDTNLTLFVANETPARTTDPVNADTDGDGIPDGEEVASGTDPLTPESSGGVMRILRILLEAEST